MSKSISDNQWNRKPSNSNKRPESGISKPTLDEILENQDNYELVEYDNGEALKAQGVRGNITARLKPEAKQEIADFINELIGEDEKDSGGVGYLGVWGANELRAEQRKKLKEWLG